MQILHVIVHLLVGGTKAAIADRIVLEYGSPGEHCTELVDHLDRERHILMTEPILRDILPRVERLSETCLAKRLEHLVSSDVTLLVSIGGVTVREQSATCV